MIISASRRTDIPAFFGDWFMRRIHEGYICVRNPMNFHQVSRVALTNDVVDCIVFWTKNPRPFIKHLDELNQLGYCYYFQYTLNGYGSDIETNVPVLESRIQTFQALSGKISPERIVWRYDPIILSKSISVDSHLSAFESIARQLYGFTHECIISFVDFYDKTLRNTKGLDTVEISSDDMKRLSFGMSDIAGSYGMKIYSCSEKENLSEAGVLHGCCIDKNKIEHIIGSNISAKKDINQRKECGCIESIDIGAYNTCKHKCLYCYANFSDTAVKSNCEKHSVNSPFLVGAGLSDDIITQRKTSSIIDRQISLF